MIGEMDIFHGESVPSNYMICNGALLPSADYPELFSIIGTKYGGDEKNFAIPDFGQLGDNIWYIIQVSNDQAVIDKLDADIAAAVAEFAVAAAAAAAEDSI